MVCLGPLSISNSQELIAQFRFSLLAVPGFTGPAVKPQSDSASSLPYQLRVNPSHYGASHQQQGFGHDCTVGSKPFHAIFFHSSFEIDNPWTGKPPPPRRD